MKNKQLKKEIIEYLVEEYYASFKELIDVWDKNELINRLNKNIKKVISNKKSAIYLGRYYIINKKIIIYNKNINNKQLELKDIKENLKLKTTILHEVTHALFRRNILTTGSFTINLGISMFKNYPKNIVKCRGLNEGATNWIVEKCGIQTHTYKIETNILKQLEIYLGTKDILDISIERTKNIHKVLGLTKKEFKKLYKMMDNINNIDIKLIRKIRYLNKLVSIKFKITNKQFLNRNEKCIALLNLYNPIKLDNSINKTNCKINKIREKRNKNALDLQECIYEKYINDFEKNASNNKLIKLYTIMLEYEQSIGNGVKVKELEKIKKIIDVRGNVNGNIN